MVVENRIQFFQILAFISVFSGCAETGDLPIHSDVDVSNQFGSSKSEMTTVDQMFDRYESSLRRSSTTASITPKSAKVFPGTLTCTYDSKNWLGYLRPTSGSSVGYSDLSHTTTSKTSTMTLNVISLKVALKGFHVRTEDYTFKDSGGISHTLTKDLSFMILTLPSFSVETYDRAEATTTTKYDLCTPNGGSDWYSCTGSVKSEVTSVAELTDVETYLAGAMIGDGHLYFDEGNDENFALDLSVKQAAIESAASPRTLKLTSYAIEEEFSHFHYASAEYTDPIGTTGGVMNYSGTTYSKVPEDYSGSLNSFPLVGNLTGSIFRCMIELDDAGTPFDLFK